MTVQLVHIANPLMPAHSARIVEVEPGISILDAIEAAGWSIPNTTVFSRHAERLTPADSPQLVKRAEWDGALLEDGEVAMLVTLPQGGKMDGSQIFAMVAMIALAIAAPEIGAALLGTNAAGVAIAGEVAFAGITYGTLATIGIVIAGALLVSAFMPAPKPFSSSSGKSASPTYSLNAQSNQARLGEVIPEWFGQYKIFPDLAARPYVDYVDNTQRVYEFFCLGMGEYEISEMGVDKTPIWQDGAPTGAYPELDVQIVNPGEQMTLFPANVFTSDEVSSIELKGTNEDGYDWSGYFNCSAPGTYASRLAVDIALPAGLFTVDDDGNTQSATVSFEFYAQQIDGDGGPIGSEFPIASETITRSSRDALRLTYTYAVTPGRYRIRGHRTNDKSDSISTADQLVWLSMRAFLPSPAIFNDRTHIAIAARATANLNGTSLQKFYVIATRKLPIYDPVTETFSANTATRRPEPVVAYLLRSSNNGQLADARIDTDVLAGFGETWNTREDRFDGGFDTRGSLWENIQTVLQVGRARPVLAGPKVSFVRDEPGTVYRAAFSPLNMKPGSFSQRYVLPDKASSDALLVQFIDARTWAQNEVLCKLPGSSATRDTAPTLQLKGITGYAHAWREGIYRVAGNRYRRRFPSFQTELEGRVCLLGDLIKVSHWLANFGSSARVVDLVEDGGGDMLTLSEPWSPPDDATKLIILTAPDGALFGPVTFALIDDGELSRQAVVRLTGSGSTAGGSYAGTQPRAWPVWDDTKMERPQALLGTGDAVAQDAKIVSMKPQAPNSASVVAVIDDPRVYSADAGDPPIEETPPDVTGGESGVGSLQITDALVNVRVEYLYNDVIGNITFYHAHVSVGGAPGANYFEAEYVIDGVTTTIGSALGRTFDFDPYTNAFTLRVRGFGASGNGDWFEKVVS